MDDIRPNDITARVEKTETLPVIMLRNVAIFPGTTCSLLIDNPTAPELMEAILSAGRQAFVVTERAYARNDPMCFDTYEIGVVASVRQVLRAPDESPRVLLDGLTRARLLHTENNGRYILGTVSLIQDEPAPADCVERIARMRSAVSIYRDYVNTVMNGSRSLIEHLNDVEDLGVCADFMAMNSMLVANERQLLLETMDPMERLDSVIVYLLRDMNVHKVEAEINDKLRGRFMKAQRENVLREQLRVIRNELGEDENDEDDELKTYRERIEAAALSEDITEKLMKEVDRLAKLPFGSSEGAVIRGYLDAVLELPWNTSTRERLDVGAAEKILNADHYGLEKVKERILEFLAVRKMAPDIKGGILCLVGPPGVGKTSVALSIAKATNRKLARVSLGGVHDEAEIRGHRKTYVGSMPGRIMAAITDAKTNNPLILLDEVDKMGYDHRGDPASALLEALDPEQNTSFRDHYLEVPFDLSRSLFITTANTTDTIPRPLLDRMEVIHISSYTDEEKLHIAKDHLLPKQRKKHGLDGRTLRVSDDAIREIISGYTRESGVRQLERKIAALCRKADMLIVSGEKKSVTVKANMLEDMLGVRVYKPELLAGKDQVGVANGLAWTSVGGTILEVEAVALEGTGRLELTGNLGSVMRESASAAMSFIRSRWEKLGVDREFYKNKDIHIHFPEGAVPKDGPSAGITIATAMVSALTGAPVKSDVAMTGEISLSGRVLPIGGLKEKTMAAFRSGVKTVIIPDDNVSDLEEIDQNVRRGLNFIAAKHLDDVLPAALIIENVGEPACSETAPTA